MASTRHVVLSAILMACVSAAAARQPMVGFLRADADRYFSEERDSHPYGTRVLVPNGFGFGLAEWQRFFGLQAHEASTLAMLCQFNVMVIDTPVDSSIMDLGPARQAAAQAARRALESYLSEGGSALLILESVRYPGDKDQDYANLVLQGLGVEMLHEGVFDRPRRFTAPIATIFPPEGFFWTENITHGHPVTEGVSRLCLPQYHAGNTPGVVALRLSPEWQVLARRAQSAQSYIVTRDSVTDYRQVGTYSSAPPIVAVRSFGKGRLMAFSVPARSAFGNYGIPCWNMIVESAGDREHSRPSDAARMMLNGLRWLAETSRDNPALGGFHAEAVAPVRFPASIACDDRRFAPPVAGVRGVIGAHTALSDGQGSVADYAAAAKAAGLSFVVFTESLEHMTPEKLSQLKAQCKQAAAADFYACPGVEFTDDLGNRWALWSERVAFPLARFNRCYGVTSDKRPPLVQWNGKVMQNIGEYWVYCAYAPNMLLTYQNLRAKGAHPANLWWFYRLPPYVYHGGKLVADQRDEWLYALRDARLLNPASYTRIDAPSQVAEAAAACTTGGRSLDAIRDWLNTRCGDFEHPANPYVTAGPTVEQWAVINRQHDLPPDVRGSQRARCRFQVSSPNGIREVLVHDANYGVIRRFLPAGQTTYAQEFEMVHDRDHALTLEVTDTQGRKAISDKAFLFCYKTSLFRCGDNFNFLDGVGLVWHPYNQMMPLVQMYQGMPAEGLTGYDSGSALTRQVGLRDWAVDHITTRELKEYPAFHLQGVLRKILSIRLPGNDVKICDMQMGPIVEAYDTLTRDTPSQTGVPAVVEENQLFARTHHSYYLQNRSNMFIAFDYRRPREGARDYRGGMVWHEGTITFKRDATLVGTMPITLFYFTPTAADPDTANTLVVQDAQGGPTMVPIPKGKIWVKEGTVAPGGFVTAAPCDSYGVFYAGSGTSFRYALVGNAAGRVNQLIVGLGKHGQRVKAGTEFRYRFAMATLGGPRVEPQRFAAQLEDIGQSFGLGGDRGVRPAFTAGRLVDREMFLTAQAEAGETSFRVEPRPTIIDLPIRLAGVDDNGCVAVYSTARPFFRFVGVADTSAWFQENVDAGSTIWAGNVFVADNKALKLTLVVDGLALGRGPYLEVHNPTDEPVRAAIVSPPHAPHFGGLRLAASVPAGASILLPLPK